MKWYVLLFIMLLISCKKPPVQTQKGCDCNPHSGQDFIDLPKQGKKTGKR